MSVAIASKEQVKKFILTVSVRYDLFVAVRDILATFEGKKMSKRIATAIEKKFPEYTVYFGKSYGWYEVTIWGNGIEYNDALRMNIGYQSNGEEFNLKNFDHNNQCYHKDADRLVEYRNQFHNYDSLVAEYEEASAAYESAVNSLGCIRYAK